MIFNFIVDMVIAVVGFIFSILPVVTIASIPIIGDVLQTSLITMIQYWNSLVLTIPYLDPLWDIVIYVILPFEIVILLGKFLLGSRMPTN